VDAVAGAKDMVAEVDEAVVVAVEDEVAKDDLTSPLPSLKKQQTNNLWEIIHLQSFHQALGCANSRNCCHHNRQFNSNLECTPHYIPHTKLSTR
jgi:hypothetical protein